MAPHFIQANTNGRLHPGTEPSISPLNRGFLYGDAIYEVWRTYHGVLFAWKEHWMRLEASARSLYLDLPWGSEEMLGQIKRTAEAFRTATGSSQDLYVRLQVTRGGGAIGLDVALADNPDFVILVQPCPMLAEGKARSGLALSVATDLRRNPVQSLDPSWKTGNYLNNLLCLRESRSRGADETVILNLSGEVTEAAVSNIGFIRSGTILTPPLSAGILNGITRRFLLGGVAAKAGLPVQEQAIVPADFGTMDECFLISTTKDVVPVASIDGTQFRIGEGTLTLRLKDEFGRMAREYSDGHPELAL